MEAVVASQRSIDPGAPAATSASAPPRSGLRDPGEAAASAAADEAPSREDSARTKAAGAWVASTYFAEGLPFVLVHKVAAEFFIAAGASLPVIGLLSFCGVPWNLKFFWSPLIDLYGGARRWLVGAEIALAVVLCALAWPAHRGALELVAAGFLAVAFAAATHDIAIDGFYMHALDRGAQAALSGLRVGAYRGALLFGGLLVALAGIGSWRACFLASGLLLGALAIAHALFLPRAGAVASDGPPSHAAGTGAAARFVEAFASFLRQPKVGRVLAFILFYRAGDALMFAMSSPLLKDLGLDTTARGLVGSIGTAASIGGSVLGGIHIARRGLSRSIFPIALLQSLAILLYVMLAWARPGAPWIVALVVMEQLAAGVGTAVLVVFLMRRCSADYKASHFAIGSALMSVAVTVSGVVSGYLAARVGFPAFFAIAFVASLPGVVLSRVVPTE